jgi:hypothetical protein
LKRYYQDELKKEKKKKGIERYRQGRRDRTKVSHLQQGSNRPLVPQQ